MDSVPACMFFECLHRNRTRHIAARWKIWTDVIDISPIVAANFHRKRRDKYKKRTIETAHTVGLTVREDWSNIESLFQSYSCSLPKVGRMFQISWFDFHALVIEEQEMFIDIWKNCFGLKSTRMKWHKLNCYYSQPVSWCFPRTNGCLQGTLDFQSS